MRNRRLFLGLYIGIAIIEVCLWSLYAQTGAARITGIVTDPTGAVIPGVTIVAINQSSGVAHETLTNESGVYVFEGINPGTYTITAELSGFKKYFSKNNEADVSAVLTVDLRLETGQISETVVVSETQAKVQTSESSISTVVDSETMVQLPLDGRNPLRLIELQPGVVGRGGSVFVSGQRMRSVNTTLDGIEVNDPALPRTELARVPVNPDSLQEYRVITSNPKAEYGRNSGATVALVTKSGTNTFHGNLFHFHRNTVFNANEFFNNATPDPTRPGRPLPRENLLRNQFGGSLGGPIVKNKTHFFFNYQGQRLSQTIKTTRTVLTSEARRGLFRWDLRGGNQPADVDRMGRPLVQFRTYDLFANDPRGLGLDPAIAAVLRRLPLPNDFTGGDGFNTALFRWNAPSSNTMDAITTRLDHEITKDHFLFARYSRGRNNIVGDNTNGGLPRFPTDPSLLPGRTQKSRSQGAAVGVNSHVSPQMINELTAGFTRTPLIFADPTYPGLRDPNAVEIKSGVWADPYIYFAGSRRVIPVYQLLDNLTFTKNNHTFKAGINFRITHFNELRHANIPRVTFGRNDAPPPSPLPGFPTDAEGMPARITPTDRNRLENLWNELLGVVGRVSRTFFSDGRAFPDDRTPSDRAFRFREFDYFFQDDWRIRPNLMLNLGLRYELKQVPFEAHGREFVPDRPLNEFPVTFLRAGPGTGRQWYKPHYNNFAPAVGFSWDPFGTGKTAVRGSYRIAYNRVISWVINVLDLNTPVLSQTEAFINSTERGQRRLSDPRGLPTLTRPIELNVTPPNLRDTTLMLDPNLRTPYIGQWSLSIQRQIAAHTIVEAAYVGSKGTKLFRMFNLNQIDIFSNGFLDGFRVVAAGGEHPLFNRLGEALPATDRRPGESGSASLRRIFASQFDRGAVAALAAALDTFGLEEGRTRFGGLLRRAGLAETFFRNPQFGIGGLGCTCSYSSYHSFRLQLARRMTKGLQVQWNYTLSKSLDDISDDTSGMTTGIELASDTRNRRRDKGRSNFDITHALRGYFIYELPFGPGERFLSGIHGWMAHALGGWQVNGIVDVSSGDPFSVNSGRQTLANGINARADFSGRNANFGRVRRDDQGRIIYFSPDETNLFAPPAPGTGGTSVRNMFTGPGFFDMDLALYKNFNIAEGKQLQFRGEVFNVLNHVNFALPNVNFDAPAFGRITNTRGAQRIIQFGLRFDF